MIPTKLYLKTSFIITTAIFLFMNELLFIQYDYKKCFSSKKDTQKDKKT